MKMLFPLKYTIRKANGYKTKYCVFHHQYINASNISFMAEVHDLDKALLAVNDANTGYHIILLIKYVLALLGGALAILLLTFIVSL